MKQSASPEPATTPPPANPPVSDEDTLATANCLFEEKQLQPAESLLRSILRASPKNAQALNLLGRVTLEAGNPVIATAFFQRATALEPDNARYHFFLGNGYRVQGRLTDAVTAYRRALELTPDDPRSLVNLAVTLRELGDTEQSLGLCRAAIALQPDFAIAHLNLGVSLLDRFEVTEAERVFREALVLAPGHAGLMMNLAGALLNQGRVAEAIAKLREVIRSHPDVADAHENLLFVLHYDPELDRHELYTEARAWERRFAAAATADPGCYPNPPDPERRLRIGYVSPDFHRHPVGYFLEGILHAHDRERVEVYCYSNHRGVDDLTERMHASTDHWRQIVGIRDDIVADVIRRDQIDILIDLAGHTANNRLGVFTHRPAPVQATWIGYFDTTGMTAFDYLIGDRFVCPPEDDACYAESILRLPQSYLCYSPQSTVAVGPPPSQRNGFVTFGCFNKVGKINKRVIETWSRILHRIPTSRLCLKDTALADPAVRQRYVELFAVNGVAADRLQLLGRTPYDEHILAYREIDVALDPFPFNGCTTTAEALWMGVPVVTAAGDRFAGRMGVSLLSTVGLPDLIAGDLDAYVDVAEAVARDTPRLEQLRATLRERIQGSSLGDGARFTRDVEAAFQTMWTAWCAARVAGKP